MDSGKERAMEKIKYEKLYFLSNQVEFEKLYKKYEELCAKNAKLDAEHLRQMLRSSDYTLNWKL